MLRPWASWRDQVPPRAPGLSPAAEASSSAQAADAERRPMPAQPSHRPSQSAQAPSPSLGKPSPLDAASPAASSGLSYDSVAGMQGQSLGRVVQGAGSRSSLAEPSMTQSRMYSRTQGGSSVATLTQHWPTVAASSDLHRQSDNALPPPMTYAQHTSQPTNSHHHDLNLEVLSEPWYTASSLQQQAASALAAGGGVGPAGVVGTPSRVAHAVSAMQHQQAPGAPGDIFAATGAGGTGRAMTTAEATACSHLSLLEDLVAQRDTPAHAPRRTPLYSLWEGKLGHARRGAHLSTHLASAFQRQARQTVASEGSLLEGERLQRRGGGDAAAANAAAQGAATCSRRAGHLQVGNRKVLKERVLAATTRSAPATALPAC